MTTAFVESEGGPLIVMAEALAAHWNGMFDAAGNPMMGIAPCDYDRACEAGLGVIGVGSPLGDEEGWALVLDTPERSTFVATEAGARIVRWIEAEGPLTLVDAALALDDEDFEEELGTVEHDGGPLVLFDAAVRGEKVAPAKRAAIDLPAGSYELRLCVEWDGEIEDKHGEPHDVVLQVIDLRRV